MALMLPRSVFYHIPKTGGEWIRLAIRTAGIPTTELGKSPNKHNTFRSASVPGKFTFTFVRHPLDWYPSFWCYRMRTGWVMEDMLDPYMSTDFEQFMKNVLKHLPGHLTRRYEQYIGPSPGMLDFVGRQENLARDLTRALRLAGEEFDENTILAAPRQNVSSNRPGYSPELLRAVGELESEAMIRFGYALERADSIRRVPP